MDKTIDFAVIADLYDSYVRTDFDIAFFKELCKGRDKILELMCGTGRVSLPLMESGCSLTCVDYSEEMLEVFRRKLGAFGHDKIICQDVCNLELGEQFDLVIIPFNSIAEINDAKKRVQALRAVFRHLLPGGGFFCTLYNPAYRIKVADGNMKPLGSFPFEEDKTLVVTYFNKYSEEDKIISGMQFYEVYDGKNMLLEKRYMKIRFPAISREEMLAEAAAAGFKLKEIYGDYSGNAYSEDSMFMNFLFEK